MSDKDAEIFYEILIMSSRAVLLGRGRNTAAYDWDVFWTRDQNIEYPRIIANIKYAEEEGEMDLMLEEKRRSVEIWEYIVNLSEEISDDTEEKPYIVTTCKYGLYLYRLYEIIYRANVLALKGGRREEVKKAVEEYDEIWIQWEELFETAEGCPSVYAKKDQFLDLIGYNWNKGLDSAINPLRVLDGNGKVLKKNQVQVITDSGWGLSGAGLN